MIMVMGLVQNRNFTLTIGNVKQSRLIRLKNGVPRESVLALLLLTIYVSDLGPITSSKFAYTDDRAPVHMLKTGRLWRRLLAETYSSYCTNVPPEMEAGT